MKKYYRAVKNWFERYEGHLSSAALLGGFITDALTLRRVDLPLENIVFLSYFLLIIIGIFLLHLSEAGRYRGPFASNLPYILPLVIQFSFGALFSGFVVFYFRSGSLVASWPFIIILVGLLLGNEFLRKHYARLVFQITTFFAAFFFFMIFFIPVIIAHMGPWVFILSGVTALFVTGLCMYIIFLSVPKKVRENARPLLYSITIVFLVINVLYFLNLIPPIPLSLKQAGIYHHVTKEGDAYIAQEEPRSKLDWLEFFQDVHVLRGEPVYAYSAVFAPKGISVEVVHHWKYFDTNLQRWVSVSRIPYVIAGGNDRGHRGYSFKSNLKEGDWMVEVETARGQVIGRMLFSVTFVSKEDMPNITEKKIM